MKISRFYTIALCATGILVVLIVGIVVIPKVYRAKAAAEFRVLGQNKAEQALKEKIKKDGAIAAWKFLQQTYLSGGMILPGNTDPHVLAHIIGNTLYDERGLDALGICGDAFTNGCFHGVIERMVITEGLAGMVRIGDVCLGQIDPGSCAHGAGHGLNEVAGYDLARSLSDCDHFPGPLSSDCAEGVLMANTSAWSQQSRFTEQQPWKICTDIPTKYQVACASAIGNYFAYALKRKYYSTDLARVCKAAPNEEMSSKCLLRVSQSIVKSAGGSVEPIKKECDAMPADQRVDCLEMAARFSVSAGYMKKDTSSSQLCEAFFSTVGETCPIK